MTTLSEIAAQLSEPFALADIDFLPKGVTEREGKKICMALPYADPRVYQDRLNSLCPGEWSTPMPTAVTVGNKLICYVTVVICGVPHSDVGEADSGENQGTEAWAQAFKRACSQAGLGRYLYNLEKEWVPFNQQRKQIDLDKAGRQAIVQKMYKKAGIMKGQTNVNQHLHTPSGIPLRGNVPDFDAPHLGNTHMDQETVSSKATQTKPKQITNSLNAPSPFELQNLFKGINQSVETAQKVLFKKVVALDNITPEDCLQLKQLYDKWEITFKERQKAS